MLFKNSTKILKADVACMKLLVTKRHGIPEGVDRQSRKNERLLFLLSTRKNTARTRQSTNCLKKTQLLELPSRCGCFFTSSNRQNNNNNNNNKQSTPSKERVSCVCVCGVVEFQILFERSWSVERTPCIGSPLESTPVRATTTSLELYRHSFLLHLCIY